MAQIYLQDIGSRLKQSFHLYDINSVPHSGKFNENEIYSIF